MTDRTVDVLLVGAGAMSATLAMMLHRLDPTLTMCMVERLDHVARESTDGWNNAGTGHAAYCELNYTSEDDNGNVNISKALTINSQFEVSLQFWSYLVKTGALPDPSKFIHHTPHCSFVWGEDNVRFLRKRFEQMSAHHLFAGMEFSDDPAVIAQWAPLVMQGRDPSTAVAATRVPHGSDVDFGALARNMIKHLEQEPSFELLLNHSVDDLKQQDDTLWRLTLNPTKGKSFNINARFVFLGAGGGALPLLQKSAIPQASGYGGFPVSGQWLVCTNPEVVSRHHAKVYGKAPIGAPPMSVPHLDTRKIGDTNALLFGPFAGFTTKFLKHGSVFDLPGSIQLDNLKPIISVGKHNVDLTKYLISEVLKSKKERVASLRDYYPEVQDADWSISHAGQRVQIIKKDANGKGKLEFGTELVTSTDGSLAALLGASPGASTAVQTMVNVVERCFHDQLENRGWKARLKEMIPSYGESLIDNAELANTIRNANNTQLKLA